MSIFSKIFDPIVGKISNEVVKKITEGEVVEKADPQRLVFDPMKYSYRSTERALRKPTRITFLTLRRMSKAVHIARLCINTLKHKVSQTEWNIVPVDGKIKADPHHINVLNEFFKHPNRNRETFRTFLDKLLEDILVLDAGCFEKVCNRGGFPAEIYYVDGATIKPMYDEHGILGDPAFCQFMPLNNSTKPDAEWSSEEFSYIMQNPQADIMNFGYGLSPLEGVIMVATNALNADNYMGQFFDVGTLPPKLINLGKDIAPQEIEAFRAYWKSEVEGKPWKTGIFGGGELTVEDMGNGKPVDMQFENYQIWLMKLLCAAYEISPQDIGMTAEMKMGGGIGNGLAEVQKELSNSKGYRSMLHLLREIFNEEIINSWFGFNDVKFDWIGMDTLDPKNAAEIFAIESKAGAVSINEYRIQKGLQPIMGGVKPMLVTAQGIQEIDAAPLKDEQEASIEEEMEDVEDVEKIEKKVYSGNYICWVDDRGFGQPFIWTDKMGKMGYVIKPPVAVNINGIDLEPVLTQEMANCGLNVKPVVVVSAKDINQYLPAAELRSEFKNYQRMTPAYDSKKWEIRFGHSREFQKYTVCEYIEGRGLTEELLLDDMKRVPDEYSKTIEDLAKLWKYEKEKSMGDRRANQYIITPDKRAWGFDYQFTGSEGAWDKYKNAIPKILEPIPKLKQLFEHLTGMDAENVETHKSMTDLFDREDAHWIGETMGLSWEDIDKGEFVMGLNEELEHIDITNGDPIKTAKIVLAHLNEDKNYYSKLKEVMKTIKKKSYKERSIEEQHNFWHKKVSVPEGKLAAHLKNQSKKLKPTMARIIKDEMVSRKAIASDKVLAEAANEVPESDIALKYTKSVARFYKQSFELGVDNYLDKVAQKLGSKGVTKEVLDKLVGKPKINKAIERSGLYDKLKERGTNMIKTVVGNKQTKLVSYIQDQADQGLPMNEIADDAMEKFALPLEDYEVQRIAATETSWAANQGSLEAGRELGIDQYEILLDPEACPECEDAYAKDGGAEGQGDVFTEKELEDVGEPPHHPNCRCEVEPYISDDNIDEVVQGILSQLK